MNKQITYNGDNYGVKYEYETERCIDGNTNHVLALLSKNGVNVVPVTIIWTDKRELSIVEKCRELINKYQDMMSLPLSYADEFDRWNGILNDN